MWTINFKRSGNSYTASFTSEFQTDSLALEAMYLIKLDNPPILQATATGPSAELDLTSAHLVYAYVAEILFNDLDVKDWDTEGDYLWPLENTPADSVFAYVDYLRHKRAGVDATIEELHLQGQHDQKSHGQRGGSGSIPADELSVIRNSDPEIQDELEDMLSSRRKVEPKYTDLLSDIAEESGGEMAGLEFKFKDAQGIANKIDRKAKEKGITPDEAADIIADPLRYTISLPPDDYVDGVKNTLSTLKAAGVAFDTVEDNWTPGDAYNGINIVFIDPETNLKIELQFHTPESFIVKDKANHKDYEFIRERKGTAADRREAFLRMQQRSDEIEFPEDIENLATVTDIPVTQRFRPWTEEAIAAAARTRAGAASWNEAERLFEAGEWTLGDWEDWVDSVLGYGTDLDVALTASATTERITEMIVPEGIKSMSDEQAIVALRKSGYNKEAAEFVLSVIKGEVEVAVD